jgi:ATP-dependent DNA helicase RecQ
MPTLHEILKTHWGHTTFLPGQEAIIQSITQGHDTLAILATGGGKSLCYQLPALYRGGLTLVISPLIALMKDQADDCNARGIPAAACTGGLTNREQDTITTRMRDGSLRLLFISPEKCLQPKFLELLQQCEVRLIAIDEAHCISEWGHDFRPEYRRLSLLKKQFPDVPVIALTATAIPQVRADIRQQLDLLHAREFTGSFNRHNLSYRIVKKKNPQIMLLDYVARHRDESGIVYCLSRNSTEECAAALRKKGYAARAYHAGLSRPMRDEVQDAFIRGTTKIICATVAFGMGIDKADTRYVIHHDIPKSIESYYQETGRAGRDGRPAECILFYSRADIAKMRRLLQIGSGDAKHQRMAIRKLEEMAAYCESAECRRKFLLAYFGEEYSEGNCHNCDTCERPTPVKRKRKVSGAASSRSVRSAIVPQAVRASNHKAPAHTFPGEFPPHPLAVGPHIS